MKDPRFVLCIIETAGVQKGKVYRVVADAFARAHKLVRIVDDSEEDYLYPSTNFTTVTVPKSAEKFLTPSQRLIIPKRVPVSNRRHS